MVRSRDVSLDRSRRIRRRSEFLKIQDTGRKVRSRYFLLAYQTKNSDGAVSRLGVTITTKVDKRSARRNRLRRRIREVFRHLRAQLREPVDVVVIALVGATELSFEEVRREVCMLLKKAGTLDSKWC